MNIMLLTNRFSTLLEPMIKCIDFNICGVAYFPINALDSKITCLLQNYGINFEVFATLDESVLHYIQNTNPDLIVVYALHYILPSQIYASPRFGSINMHPSLLPKYKGKNPWCEQYKNIPDKFGMTIHTISSGVDSGEILSQCEFSYNETMTLDEFKEFSIQRYGFPLLREVIKKMKNSM